MADNSNNQNNPQTQREFNDAINEYRSLLKSISSELGQQRSHVASANAEYRKMDSIARQLQSTQQGIDGLTSDQIIKLQKGYDLSVKEVQNQAKILLNQRGITNLTNTQLKYLKQKGELTEKESALLEGYLQDFELEKSFSETINAKLEERVKYETEVKALTGATGAILESTKGTMDKLGLSSLSNYLNVDAAKKAMQAEADAIARGEKEGGKLQVRMAGIKTLAEGLNKALFSTEAVIGFIVQQLAKGSQNMADFRKQTGMSYESAYAMNMEMKGIAIASGDNFITSEKLNKSFAMMTEHLGVSADILGGTALVSATNLSERLGMSADNAAQLTTYTRLQGKDTEKILSNSVATVGAFNKQNKTAINSRQVLEDVAGASKSMYLNMGKSTEALTKAATKARALGLSLGQVEKISESLLNFEDSIGNELQANLLLGGGVNLAKAREYALTGDTAKLTEEIGKQESIRNAFATKNVIAQKAAADALGISKEELAGMALQQDLNNLSAEEFKNRYGETTYESMKSRSASEKLGDAMDKVKDILGSIVQVFTPFLDILASILSFPLAPYFISAFVAAKLLGGSIGGIGKAFSGMYDLGKQALTGLGGLFKKGGLAEGAGALRGKVMAGAASATPTPAAGGMTSGVSSINTTALLKGAAAMAVAAAGIWIFGKAVQELEKVKDWGRVAMGLGAFAASMLVLGGIGMAVGVGLELMVPPMLAFGAAVLMVGAGIGMATSGISMFIDSISKLTMNSIEPMLLLGPALFGIAAGLGAIALAGPMAIPALLAVTGLAAVATVFGAGDSKSAGEAKGKADEGSLLAVEKKLDALIVAVKAGGNVYMDSNKVGRAQVLGSYKSA